MSFGAFSPTLYLDFRQPCETYQNSGLRVHSVYTVFLLLAVRGNLVYFRFFQVSTTLYLADGWL